MATFYYNQHSGENMKSQWTKYLQTESFVLDINHVLTKNKNELMNVGRDQHETVRAVLGNVEQGFTELSNYLNQINYNIGELRSELNDISMLLDWKLTEMIESQRATNQLLGQVSQLLRIPDSQKQRIYFIEQGLKYLKNALLQGCASSYYSDAIESFKSAETIERKDYITLNKIGFIYLYSQQYYNPGLALEYFLRSAREAIAESNIGGTPTSNNLRPIGFENTYKSTASEALIYAGRCCYHLLDYDKAAELAGEALKISPSYYDALFDQAKYFAKGGNLEGCIDNINKLISHNRYYTMKILDDKDLINIDEVRFYLEKISSDLISYMKTEANKLNNVAKKKSGAEPLLHQMNEYIIQNNYISACRSWDILTQKHKLKYYLNYRKNDLVMRESKVEETTLAEFLEKEIKSEGEFKNLLSKANNYIRYHRMLTCVFTGLAIGLFVALERSCSTVGDENSGSFYSVLLFTFLGAIIGALIVQNTKPHVTIN